MDNAPSPEQIRYNISTASGHYLAEIEGWHGPEELDLELTAPSGEVLPLRYERGTVRSRRIRSVVPAGSYAGMTFHRNEYEPLSTEVSEVAMRAIKMFCAKQQGSEGSDT
jgi:hypothetical protein